MKTKKMTVKCLSEIFKHEAMEGVGQMQLGPAVLGFESSVGLSCLGS